METLIVKISAPNAISAKRKAALTKGFQELQFAEAGKLKTKPATALLKELRNCKK